jgi:polyferredoxin/ferredoxin
VNVTRFGDSWLNLTRITTIRIVSQTVIFGLFLAFVLLTTFANLDRLPGLRHWVSKILEIDPLVSLATAVTTHTVYKGLLWSLIILIPTLFLGRFFCNWVCPYGTLHQFVGWLFRKSTVKELRDANRYRRAQHLKYYILAAMLVAALFGSLQIGLLDPICLLYRSVTGAVLPAANMPTQRLFGDYSLHQGAWLIGFLLFGLLAMNLIIPRFFCRVLCPLGALLGVLSRFAWWRIERDPVACGGCNLCVVDCEGASDPHDRLRMSECFVCFNCVESCPDHAIRFAFFPPKDHAIGKTDVSRRKAVFAAVTGLLFFPFARASGKTTRDFSSKVIRPPGTVEELEFLERCIKCDQCIRVCPTSVLQPALFESGLEGLWTPVLNFRIGHCQYNCTACSHVCPTGAIQRTSVDRKHGVGAFADQGPVRLGTAHFDTGRCLPYAKNMACTVCEEVCPTSPKAIYTQRETRPLRDGRKSAVASTDNTVTLAGWPQPGQPVGERVVFDINGWKGDGTTAYHLAVRHDDGVTEQHRIIANDTDTVMIEGRFARKPKPGAAVTLLVEHPLPRIDASLCIGCGICEFMCPVVGDQRAIYVTSVGETRSENYGDPDRNRSLRLNKIATGPNTRDRDAGREPDLTRYLS